MHRDAPDTPIGAGRRRAGVLLHPTSLPGERGAGDLGRVAHRFVDWLAAARQSVWQLLPLGPTGAGDSPYSSPSTLAGDPRLISVDGLVDDGLLPRGPRAPGSVLGQAWDEFRRRPPRALRRAFDEWIDAPHRRRRLDDWALYAALRERHGGARWTSWPAELRRREPRALRRAFDSLADRIALERFVQFVFDRQCRALREAAAQRGIELFGDVPFYVAHESADVWADQSLFRLDGDGRPTHVAGVPPDYFSETGQLWGDPVFDWAAMAADGYRWWIDRVRTAYERTPLVRLDHFRAFAAYWEVPAGAATALDGRWVPGPGRALFDALDGAPGPAGRLVAEDLGEITDDVRELRDALGLPGMRITQFGLLDPDSEHDPANHPPNAVAYTGTHDNAPIRGWLDELTAAERARALARLRSDVDGAAWRSVELTWLGAADLAIAPVQDLLGLGADARMNRPGVADGNWRWRLEPGCPDPDTAERLARLTARSGRG